MSRATSATWISITRLPPRQTSTKLRNISTNSRNARQILRTRFPGRILTRMPYRSRHLNMQSPHVSRLWGRTTHTTEVRIGSNSIVELQGRPSSHSRSVVRSFARA